MLGSALAVIEDPGFAAISSRPARWPKCRSRRRSMASVVAGTADRLLVDARRRITVVDFKTAAPPAGNCSTHSDGDDAADGGLWRGACRRSIRGATVRAAVLYTHAPQLFEIAGRRRSSATSRVCEAQENFALPALSERHRA